MTVNELIWKVLANEDDENEVIAMTIVVKDKDGTITCYGIDDYGGWYQK